MFDVNSPENIQKPQSKQKKKKDPMDFSKKARESRQDRLNRIDQLKKEILSFIDKNKIDDRDAKPALKEALDIIKDRCKIEK